MNTRIDYVISSPSVLKFYTNHPAHMSNDLDLGVEAGQCSPAPNEPNLNIVVIQTGGFLLLWHAMIDDDLLR
ncbi:hypothetical protein N7495_003205 [Penicillium taxi]|uniref:uncharacterized protein n=1 Tax=Penicillium taxi TaxID=168475 RepID=UPI0025451353|nr:uncharacterized protein N7495_003205 [Penicillium taxi]KAJ5902677.1 hypothetical protein N7495_003205 [Penicillium taxi]